MAVVKFEGVYKLFGERSAVDDLRLEIADGEFLVLVGPSGCGKTTTLRMLGGVERPTFGRILIGDVVVNNIPAKDRDIAMVFQNYALFPHLDVYDNLAFGLKVRREPRKEIRRQIEEVSKVIGINGLLKQRPGQLSGGERQRVALGRAMLRRPQVFLLDEPLSNLDAALRGEMRAELTRLHARLRVATLYVTHDQVEAMTMGDRIGVMCDGRLQQVDVPETIYDHPVNLFVATFIGSPKMNIIPGRVVERGVNTVLECLGKRFGIRDVLAAPSTSDILLGVRPEDVHWLPVEDARSSDAISGVVEVVEPMGAEAFVTVLCNGERIKARFPSRSGIQVGDAVDLAFAAERMQIFDAQTSVNLKVRQAGPKYAEKEEAV